MNRVTKLAGIIVAIGAAACGGALAQEKGTAAQREACTPDAFRLCVTSMPDADAVEQCLRRAGPRLSPACYAVFNPPQPDQRAAQTPPSPTVGQAPARRQVQPQDRTLRDDRPLIAPPQITLPSSDDDD